MKRIALGILATAAFAAHAEPMYISDKLVVNVYAEADQESAKLATLDSGDAVEAIEKVESFTRVRLPDEREGWIKSSYLSNQTPAIVRLRELEKERGVSAPAPATQLVDELKKANELNAALQSELVAAKQAAVQSPTVVPAAPASQVHESEPASRNSASPNWTQHISWSAGLVFLGCLIGFALGYQTLARRIRRKYGSVRIY